MIEKLRHTYDTEVYTQDTSRHLGQKSPKGRPCVRKPNRSLLSIILLSDMNFETSEDEQLAPRRIAVTQKDVVWVAVLWKDVA